MYYYCIVYVSFIYDAMMHILFKYEFFLVFTSIYYLFVICVCMCIYILCFLCVLYLYVMFGIVSSLFMFFIYLIY